MHTLFGGLRRRVDGGWIIGVGVHGFAAALTMQLVRNSVGNLGPLVQLLSLAVGRRLRIA